MGETNDLSLFRRNKRRKQLTTKDARHAQFFVGIKDVNNINILGQNALLNFLGGVANFGSKEKDRDQSLGSGQIMSRGESWG